MPGSLASEPHPGLAAAREPRATRPRPDAEALRAAYLELLKLCLCDLTGTSTVSVGTADNVTFSRELTGDQLRMRAAGMDWPQQGLTMIGLTRLDDLQSCVESVVREGISGDLIEAGAWRGGASILMRATLDTLGADERTVYVADSFEGFPATDTGQGRYDWAALDFLAVPLEEVEANFTRFGLERGVTFVPGFFEETLVGLSDGTWSLVRLDADTYESTRVALERLYPGLSLGGYLIVDDYGALEECRRAVDEFRRAHGIDEPLEEVDWTCVRWRRRSETPLESPAPAAGPAADGTGPPRSAERRATRVPTSHELQLIRELDALRRRLEVAEAEVERLRGSPLAAPREWLARKLTRNDR